MADRLKNLARSYSLDPKILYKNIRWRFPRSVSQQNHVFVVGCPRSGTTLLQVMLSQHSELFCYQRETEAFSYRGIFDPRRIWFGLPRGVIHRLHHNCTDIVEFFDTCVNLIRQDTNRRFVEKTPQHVLHLPFIFKWFPESQIIHIVRDGRDCYCSSKISANIPQNKSIDSFARYWKKCVSEPIKLSHKNNLYTVKYEDLVTSSNFVLPEIMKFLGLAFEDVQLDTSLYAKDNRSRRVEFKKLATEITTSSIGRWRKELAAKDIDEFNRIAGFELEHYGYIKD